MQAGSRSGLAYGNAIATRATGRWLRLTLVASVLAIASFPAAGTAEASHSIDLNITTDFHNFFPDPPSNAYAFGHIDAGPTPCMRNRTLKLYKLQPRILIDTDRSSNNGKFGLGGDLSGANAVQIKMARKTFGPRGNRHTCESDTNTFG